MRQTSRFIPGEAIASVAQWQFSGVQSAFEVSMPQHCAVETVPAPPDLQGQEAYAQGFVEGRAQAQLEAQQRIDDFLREQGQTSADHLASVVNTAQSQLDAAAQDMAEGVLVLACEMSRQVLLRELSIDPQSLLPVIRQALGAFIEEERTIQIKLHPEDLALLQAPLRQELGPGSLSLEADPLLSRGGCVLESAGRVVNGQIEKRWARVVGQLGLHMPWEISDEPE